MANDGLPSTDFSAIEKFDCSVEWIYVSNGEDVPASIRTLSFLNRIYVCRYFPGICGDTRLSNWNHRTC